jgi:ATP-dependent DNA helicase RecG
MDIDLEKLKTISCHNILDLALITPSSYEDNTLYNHVILNSENVIDAKILNTNFSGKVLQINIFAKNLNQNINGIIFSVMPYHYAIFKKDEELFIKGKIEQNPYNNNQLQIVQPRKITVINEIEVKYKHPKSRTIKSLLKKYLNIENLKHYGLYEEIAKNIVDIHFPTKEFLDSYKRNSEFSGKYLYSLKYLELFNYLRRLSNKRKDFKAIKILDNDLEPFVKALPFKLTNDQQKAIDDIKYDFTSTIASKRVIMGDVGCGKTMVILSSVVMSYPNKAILMAPTTILANQLFEEAQKYLPDYIKTKLVTAKTKSKKLKLDEYDFIIGTHALLYQDLPKVALVMIDEQHRFGTKQRNALNEFAKEDDLKPHFLQFTATPIPRTMAMIDSSLVDYSFIKDIPFKKDITTTVIRKQDFKNLISHIKDEIEKNNQTIIVYPLVEQSEAIKYSSIEEAQEYWLNNFEKVYITHGKDKEKEKILENFREDGNILLATTLIEVGISLPRLSTIVIVGAERMGLATLHQLRGRVSRTGLKGYCFLYTNLEFSNRLEKFSKTLSGFDIANIDLEFRQAGDLLSGANQSGKSFKFVDLSQDEEIIQEVKSLINNSPK